MAENSNAAGSGDGDEEISLLLEAKGGDKYPVKKSVVSCVKFVTGMLEGTFPYLFSPPPVPHIHLRMY